MKKFLLTLFLFFVSFSFWGQNLIREKWQYSLNGKILSQSEVKQLYKKIPEAHKNFKKAQLQLGISSGLILLGGAYTGERIGRFTATGDIEWKKTGIGLGILSLGITSSIGLNKKFDAAVKAYNNQKAKKATASLVPTPRGLVFVLNF